MTGYATASAGSPRGALTLELRSVNSRFLDLQFRIADELRGLEPMLRERIAAFGERLKDRDRGGKIIRAVRCLGVLHRLGILRERRARAGEQQHNENASQYLQFPLQHQWTFSRSIR